jgi:DNA repair exonuclease SbcCD ATPase subunit
MQLVVARVAAAGAVASETSARTSLEAARQSTEDRAISAETAAAAAATERDSLAWKLALAEAEMEKLRVAAAFAEEVAKRAKTVTATAKSAAREASQTAAREKAALEAKVSELESDLRTATTDLATTSCQFSQTTNQLQVVTEQAARLQSSNAKLSQDLEGKSDDSSVLAHLSTCFLSRRDLKILVAGSRMIRAGMVVQLATVNQERNAAILKFIEKDGVLKRLSKQLQKVQTELEQDRASREKDATALNQAREARRKSEAITEKAIGDVAKLGRSLSLTMIALGVSFGPRTPEALIEEVGRLPSVVRELELSTARCAVHWVLAMIESHYQGLDRKALSGGWALSISDDQCNELEMDCAAFACEMADAALTGLELLPQDESKAPRVPGPPN